MPELLKQERDIVIPGDTIVQSMEYLPGRHTFREGESILAKRLGLVSLNGRVISVVPLNAAYQPREADMVIGTVVDVQGTSGWVVDIKAMADGFLPIGGVREYIDTRRSSLDRYYQVGDTIYAKVQEARGTSTYLSMQDVKCRKFHGGRLVVVNNTKIPRIIGKQGSMIQIIKDGTGCKINAGQNGVIWLDGGDMDKAVEAIVLIAEQAATEGLTDKVSKLLGIAAAPKAEAEVASDGESFAADEGGGA